MQNRPLSERFVGTLNIGYDGYYKRIILGIGLSVSIIKDLGLIHQISLVGEYYPVLDRENADTHLSRYMGSGNGFSLGIKLDTYGHRFFILLTNTDDLHFHRTALGLPEDSHWRLGFNIERKLKL